MTTMTAETPTRTPWLHRAVALGAAVHAARVARRFRQLDNALLAQRTAFRELMVGFGATTFGAKFGLDATTPYEDFRRRIAPRTYEQLAPWIDRMKRGEADVLWPGRCAYYAVSSGTTQGRTKYLPITEPMLAHFRRAGLDSLCLYARRTGRSTVFAGRHLFLGGSTTLAPVPDAAPFDAWAGDLSGITALHLPSWAERFLYEPGREIAQMADWPEKLRAMARRTAGRDVRLLAGIPSWILVFAETMRRQTGRLTLKDVWPRFECLVHGGVPIGPFATELRAAVGPDVNFHEVYPASEGFIAAQDEEPEAGLRLLVDAGIFYEFLPVESYRRAPLGELAEHVVPLEDVEPDVDYVIVITTPAGLCRYVIGDVVRFVSTRPPRLRYVGRTALQLSAFGEHVIEKELTDALAAAGDRYGLTVANFHVAPLFVSTAVGATRGRHEWWIELRRSAEAVPVEALSRTLDLELQRLNDDYEAKRRGGGLDVPVVRIVAPGTFERWLRGRGKWGGQHKMPRCRSDRQVADELARY